MSNISTIEINKLKKGDFFMIANNTPKGKNVWVYDGYNRNTKKYSAYNFNDISHFIERKKGAKVFIGFEF